MKKQITRIARKIANKFGWDCTLALYLTEFYLKIDAFKLNNLVYDRECDIDIEKAESINPVFNHVLKEYEIDDWTSQEIYDLVIAVNSECNMHSFNTALENILVGDEALSISGNSINLDQEVIAPSDVDYSPTLK